MTAQEQATLDALKAKQAFTFKACEMEAIREQVKISKQNLTKMTYFTTDPKTGKRIATTERPANFGGIKPAAPKTAAASKPTTAASKPFVVHRAATATAKAESKPNLITAAEYETKPKEMTLSEFNKLKPAGRMKFIKQGGKII